MYAIRSYYAFSFPDSPTCDETPYIAAVAAQGDLEPHRVDCDALSPLSHLDDLLEACGEPFIGAHMPYRWAVGRLAEQLGVGVLLEGNGGDAVVSYGHYFVAA